jgi:hypothetical protein
VLEVAATAWDRAEQARETLLREELTVETKQGRRAHPCVGIERDAKTIFMRALRELDLDADGPRVETYSRPPGLRSNRRY